MKNYKIAVYTICKNEENFVDRWVDSMKEADEIIVVDTGSSDSTIEKFHLRGISVYNAIITPWRFDDARNIALNYISPDTDICVSTDLDEVFEAGWRKKLENVWESNTSRLLYTFQSAFNNDGIAIFSFLKEKIHANHSYKWIKPVHEVLEYIGQSTEVIKSEPSIILKHYPSTNKNREQYLPLLKLSIDENPNDDRNMHYLGREYMFKGLYNEAIETLKQHLDMNTATWKEERCASMRFIARCYLAKRDYHSSEKWLIKAISECPNTREPYTELGKLYFNCGMWNECYKMVQLALKITSQMKTYLLESFCWDHTLYFLGAISNLNLGKTDIFKEFITIAKNLNPHDKDINHYYSLISNNAIIYNKVSIIILTYNNLQFTKKCLESIRKFTPISSYEIIIVDNLSTDETRTWLLSQENIKIVFNKENLGFPRGCNIGIKLAEENNDILLLNNDVEVTYNWLINLQTALHHSQVGAVGASTFSDYEGYFKRTGVKVDFSNKDTFNEFILNNNISNSTRWEFRNKLIAYCLLIKREVLNKVGLLDEVFSPGTYEDDDLSLRIMQAGYYLRFCYDSYVHHYESISFKKDLNAYKTLLFTNGNIFKDKWKFNSNDKCICQTDLVSLVNENLDLSFNILQWNSGLASTLLLLKSRYVNANLFGIEPNEHYNIITRNLINVSNRCDFPLNFPENSFHYILLGNELENRSNPLEFLINLRKYLKPKGKIICTFNNIMHYLSIRNILDGFFATSNGNYIDRSNRFLLSKKDIEILCEKGGFIINDYINWYHILNMEDEAYIDSLCKITSKENSDLFKTYSFTISLQMY